MVAFNDPYDCQMCRNHQTVCKFHREMEDHMARKKAADGVVDEPEATEEIEDILDSTPTNKRASMSVGGVEFIPNPVNHLIFQLVVPPGTPMYMDTRPDGTLVIEAIRREGA